MNTKLHAICDSQGRPPPLFVTAGQVSDYIGARALLSSLPNVISLRGDRGYDADWFREALKDKGIGNICAPNPTWVVDHDVALQIGPDFMLWLLLARVKFLMIWD